MTMSKNLFRPGAGQVDYTKIRWAPVINCVLKYKNKILLVQRSSELHFYPGHWNGISGFLDDHKNLQEKVKSELKDELGMPASAIRSIRLGKIFDQDAPRYKKTWIVHPVLVEVAANKIKLDWEANKYKWVAIREAKHFKLLPGFDRVILAAEKLMSRKEK